MSPVLAKAASDLHVSTAAAGQLRTVTGLAAGLTALTLGAVTARVALGRLCWSVGTARGRLARERTGADYPLLVAAQLPVGVAVAVLTSVGTLAAAEWVHPDLRTRALRGRSSVSPRRGSSACRSSGSWANEAGATAARAAARRRDRCGLARRTPSRKATRFVSSAASERRSPRPDDRALARIGASRHTAWAGTLVFAGALFTESYDASTALTGCLLAVAAAAYVAGNLACRRLVQREPRAVLVLFASSLALVDGLFGIARVDVLGSAALLAGAGFLAGGRTLVTSAFALSMPPDVRPTITSLRAATMQLGYFVGSLVGGAALATGGYGALAGDGGLLPGSPPPSHDGRSRVGPEARVRPDPPFTGHEGDPQPACHRLERRKRRHERSTR